MVGCGGDSSDDSAIAAPVPEATPSSESGAEETSASDDSSGDESSSSESPTTEATSSEETPAEPEDSEAVFCSAFAELAEADGLGPDVSQAEIDAYRANLTAIDSNAPADLTDSVEIVTAHFGRGADSAQFSLDDPANRDQYVDDFVSAIPSGLSEAAISIEAWSDQNC